MVCHIPCVHLGGRPSQCFPYYTYAEDGTNRRENITDWALEQFRARYSDRSITKWDIFHYIYAVLHHPEYRQRYNANLRRELPRIPFVSAKPDHVGADALVCPAGQSPAALQPAASKPAASKPAALKPAALKGDGFSHPAPPTSTLSSRAAQDDSLANRPGESRDLLSSHQSVTQANGRSFDSADGLASEPTCFAQDDRGLGLQHGAPEGALSKRP